MPVGLGVVLVAVVLPCVDFVGEDLLVGDAAIQTLRREHAEIARVLSKRLDYIDGEDSVFQRE